MIHLNKLSFFTNSSHPEFPNPKVGHRFAEAAGFTPGTTELVVNQPVGGIPRIWHLRGVLQGLTPRHQLEGSHTVNSSTEIGGEISPLTHLSYLF